MSTYEKGVMSQYLGFPRPKYVVQEGLKMKIQQDAPNLAKTFDVTFDYPKRETMANSANGQASPVRRRIVIKKLSSVPITKGLGEVYTSEHYDTGRIGLTVGTTATGFGQVDEHTIEISVWSPDSRDRDSTLELIKMWMLELNQRIEPETGNRFFNRNGIFAVTEVKNYENIDRKSDQTDYYIGILVYKLVCPFYGVQVETFEKIKFDLISNLYDPKGPPQITIPDKPTVVDNPLPDTVDIPSIGGPGFGQDNTKDEDTIKIPDPPKMGGNGDASYGDIIYIPGERTEVGYVEYDLSLLHDEED